MPVAVSVERRAQETRRRRPAGAAKAAGKPAAPDPVFPSLDTPGTSVSTPRPHPAGNPCDCADPTGDVDTSRAREDPSGQGIRPDAAWTYSFREAVAAELESRWPTRADAMRECGSGAVKLQCEGCGELTLVPFRCEARTCPYCARAGAAAVADRIGARVAVHDLEIEAEPWDGPGRRQLRSWRMLTLTRPAPANVAERFDPDELHAAVRSVRESFRTFWRSTAWGRRPRDPETGRRRVRRDTSYVFALEVAPGGMVHVHALVYGEYVAQAKLQAAWSRALGEARAIVHVRTADDPAGGVDALREVLKYATKGEKGTRVQAERAAAVECALRNTKRITIGGALRKVRIDPEDGETDDIRPEDVHDRAEAACEGCGLIGEWKWIGTATAVTVERNQGYGIMRTGPPAAPP